MPLPDWERLRRMILGSGGHRCEACGATEDRDSRRWLGVHERWRYDHRTGAQPLRRLLCLCSPRHLMTHIGYVNVTGRADEVLAHLRRVTSMSDQQVSHHVDDAGRLWTERSDRTLHLDLRMLTDAGVTLQRPEAPAQRSQTADRALDLARVTDQAAAVRPGGWRS